MATWIIYGPYGDLAGSSVQFSKSGTPAKFTFTSKNALQLVDKTTKVKRYVTTLTDTNLQLIITDNCVLEDQWAYDSTAHVLYTGCDNR